MAGSLGRTLGPLIVSFLFDHFGPEATWGLEIGVLTFTISLWAIFYKRLVPNEEEPLIKL